MRAAKSGTAAGSAVISIPCYFLRIGLIAALAAALPCVGSAQIAAPKVKMLDASYYVQPLEGRLLLSANFAEARTNHLHSGIDIKTGGAEGKPLRAVADGEIVRIGVIPAGYGRVLYIAHPNGTTSVYAHMQKFTPEVEKYVDDQRYALRQHRVDLYPKAGAFPVKQGELIGLSGNSGRSGGPHLHFEIRETASQRTLNVAAQRVYEITDDIRPTIVQLHYVEVDSIGVVPLNSKPRAIALRHSGEGVYEPADTAAFQAGPRGYFVLEATDRKNDTQNTMGIYRAQATLDGAPVFGFRLDGHLFTDTKYVNSLNHYKFQRGSRNELLRLAVQDGNRLPAYENVVNRGLITLRDDRVHIYELEVWDDNGNCARLALPMKRSADEKKFYTDKALQGTPLDNRRAFSHRIGGLEVEIPAGALYEPVFFTVGIDDGAKPNGEQTARIPRFSPVYRVFDGDVPLHSSMTVSIRPDEAPESLRPRLCLASVSSNGTKYDYAGGSYADGKVTAKAGSLGRYCVVADTVPPAVTPNFAEGADLRGKNSVTFTIKDNFSGVASFEATIDGRWIPFEQNVMQGTITHRFNPERIEYGGASHALVLTVADNKGNKTVVRRSFVR